MRTLAVLLAVVAVSSQSDGCFFWTGGCDNSTVEINESADTRNVAANDDERIVNVPTGGSAGNINANVAADLIGLLNGAVGSSGVEVLPNGGVGVGGSHGGAVGVGAGGVHSGGSLGGVNSGGSLGGGVHSGGSIGGVNSGGSIGGGVHSGGSIGGGGVHSGSSVDGGVHSGGSVGVQPGGVVDVVATEESCFTPEGRPGVCVPYFLCNDGNVNTDGAGIIDIRLGNNKPCIDFLEVCCHHVTNDPPTPPPYVSTCGRKNTEGFDVRITGFQHNEAQFAEFPWMVAILRKERVGTKEVNLYVCGGSLIHPSVVLTAAHCVVQKAAGSLKVRLGEWDTQRTNERYLHQDRGVLKVVTSQEYNSGALYNDFALLFLDTPADLAPNVDTICLPDSFSNFEGQTCYATGWGRDDFGKEGKFANILKEVALPVVSNPYCQERLRSTRLGSFFQLHNSFLCAGGKAGLDTCKGDGGSPLVCQAGNGPFVQVGIVAWGIGCGEDGIPGVYASVPFGSDWIKREADLGLQQLYGLQGHNWAYSV